MPQFGGGRMGGVALSAGGTSPQDLRNIPKGPVDRIFLTISLGLKSTGSAFAAVVSTADQAASEGTDDLDLLLNACFQQIAFYWDAESLAFNHTPAQMRTFLGLMNQKDFVGTLKNGVSIPASGGSPTTFKVVIPIPVSLDSYFRDGTLFRNGSTRLSEGRIEYTCGASLTPTVVLANGSAVVSGLSVALTAELGAGTEHDIGMTWRVKRLTGLPNVYEFDDALRIGMLDASPAASNSATAYNAGDFEQWNPTDFQAKYQSERLQQGGFDITARCTPLEWLRPDTGLLDFQARLGKRSKIDATGVSSLAIYDIQALSAPATTVARVAQRVGGGGEVHTMHPTPPSLPPGHAVPAHLASLMPVRVQPGSAPGAAAGSANHASSPDAAAAHQVARQANTAKAKGMLGMFNRPRY